MSRSNRKTAQKGSRVKRVSDRHAFDSAPVGLALVGPEGRFLQVNPRLCRLLGYAEKQLLASTLGAVTDPHDLKTLAVRSSIPAAPAIETLKHLGAIGIGLALDHFGSGFSSLAHLKPLPFREVKIDRSFIARMSGEEGISVVRPMIDLGHTMGLKVVAAGVEDQGTLDRLRAIGCDSAQGFYLCAPIPAADLTIWMQRSVWGLVE